MILYCPHSNSFLNVQFDKFSSYLIVVKYTQHKIFHLNHFSNALLESVPLLPPVRLRKSQEKKV
jgi:hypothetical protein